MKKVALFTICLLALGVGCTKNQLAEEKNVDTQPVATSTKLVDDPKTDTTTVKTTNEKRPHQNTALARLVANLCHDKQSLGLAGYDGGAILKCGEYIKVIPPENLDDAPDVLFTNTSKIAARCGGMPGPEPQEFPAACSIACAKTGLFLCSAPATKQ